MQRFHLNCHLTGCAVCYCKKAALAPGSLSYPAAQSLWGAWCSALQELHNPTVDVAEVLTPQLYILPGPEEDAAAGRDEAADASHQLAQQVKTAELKAAALTKRATLLALASGQTAQLPEGAPAVSVPPPAVTVGSLQGDLQQLDEQLQQLQERLGSAESEQQQLLAQQAEQASNLRKELQEARRAAAALGSAADQTRPDSGRRSQQVQGGKRAAHGGDAPEGLQPQAKRSRPASSRAAESPAAAASTAAARRQHTHLSVQDPAAARSSSRPRSSVQPAAPGTPGGAGLLQPKDYTHALTNVWLQLYWPDDGQWWPGLCTAVDLDKRTATIMYDTGEQEQVNLLQLIQRQEVAWGHAATV